MLNELKKIKQAIEALNATMQEFLALARTTDASLASIADSLKKIASSEDPVVGIALEPHMPTTH